MSVILGNHKGMINFRLVKSVKCHYDLIKIVFRKVKFYNSRKDRKI